MGPDWKRRSGQAAAARRPVPPLFFAIAMKPARLQTPATERLIFWSVAVLLLSQMGWWISLQMRQSRALQDARSATLRAGRAEAWQLDSAEIIRIAFQQEVSNPRATAIEARLPLFPALASRKLAIEKRFPYVAVVASPVAPDDPMLLDESAYLTLRMDFLERMERERRLALWRAAGEAGVMLLVVLLGLSYIYRKLNTETELMLRQQNFIAAVTHELKTPIASLRVWTETLFTRELGEERLARIQTLMDGDLSRLNELVGNLLEAARADAGSLDLQPERVELGPWIRAAAEAMQQRLGSASLGLDLQLGIDIWADIDARAFATVLENLLSNAHKYAAAPRSTLVTLDSDGEKAILAVTDRGNGISPKELPRLFQRFYRVGDEMTRQVPGTGLGLFLCSEIMTLHRGNIQASSSGLGQGSTFTIRLPLSPR